MRAPFRFALGEGLMFAAVGVGQMVDAAEHGAEMLAVRHDAADRDAAEAAAVIAALAADQPGAARLAAHVVVGDGDLQRRVDRLRTGVREEDVVEVARRQRRDAGRDREGLGMTELERGCEIEFRGLRLDGLDDGLAVVAGIGAPEARGAVHHGAPVRRVVEHVLGPRDHARALLERAVRRIRHPEGFEIVRDVGLRGESGVG